MARAVEAPAPAPAPALASARAPRWPRRAAAGLLALAGLAGGLALLAAAGAQGDPGGPDGVPAPPRRLQAAGSETVHVCLTTDGADLRAVAVAVRSALASSRTPERLHFHLVVAEGVAGVVREVVKAHLQDVRVSVRHRGSLQRRIESWISVRDTSRARRSLATPFNLAPFYLHEFLAGGKKKKKKFAGSRIIYLDVDSVVLGDLAEIFDMDLRGHPVAAVRDCRERWEDYIDFEALHSLGITDYDPQACVTRRSIFAYDVSAWTKSNVTGRIEEWLLRYERSSSDLWFDGVSMAPWMLALDTDYMALGEEWACDGLSRESMSLPESRSLRKHGFDYTAFKTLGVQFSDYGRIQPYVATCSSVAKVLHFDGGMRPWHLDRFDKMPPVCVLPVSLQEQQWKWSRRVKVYCEETTFISCAEVWWRYISADIACALKDFNKEWQAHEEMWLDHQLDAEEVVWVAQREAVDKMQEDDQERWFREEDKLKDKRRLRFRQRWGSDEGASWRARRDQGRAAAGAAAGAPALGATQAAGQAASGAAGLKGDGDVAGVHAASGEEGKEEERGSGEDADEE